MSTATAPALSNPGNLRGQSSLNTKDSIKPTPQDREIALLLIAYPGRMRIPDPEDLWALFDFLQDDLSMNVDGLNTGCPDTLQWRERGGR